MPTHDCPCCYEYWWQNPAFWHGLWAPAFVASVFVVLIALIVLFIDGFKKRRNLIVQIAYGVAILPCAYFALFLIEIPGCM